MTRRTLGAPVALALLCVLFAACGSTDSSDASVEEASDLGRPDTGRDLGPPDLGPPDTGPQQPDLGDVGTIYPDLGPLHDLTELTVEGKVNLDFGAVGPRVSVSTHCGGRTEQILTDDNGNYALHTDVADCQQLVVEFSKESYLPTYRVVHLPPPASPVTMNVNLTALKELLCGSQKCVVENDYISSFPPGPMTRGWVASLSGATSMDYLGGEFRDTLGRILWVTGFAFFDFRDDDGARLDSFPAFTECFQVQFEALDQIVDVRPETDDLIEMNLYSLEPSTGRWISHGPEAFVALSMNAPGESVEEMPQGIRPALRVEKDDIRSNQLGSMAWVCAPISGSGWYAWGASIPETSCIALSVRDQCSYPRENVVFRIQGRDYGFLAETWTDRGGIACLEAARSEPLGQDHNLNELNGETFWVDAKLTINGAETRFNALEIPREAGSCLSPETCVPLDHTAIDFSIMDCASRPPRD